MPPVENAPSPGPRAPWLRRLPILVILTTAMVGTILLRDTISFDALARHRAALLAFRDTHYLMTVLGFVTLYIAIVALSLPGGTVATLAGGFLFGLFPGVLYNVTGATVGAIAIFLAARSGFGDRLAVRLRSGGGAAARLMAGIKDNEWSVLFLMRLIPAVPFFLANLIPAFTGTRLSTFAVTTFLGIIPAGLVFTSVGAGLGEVFARGETPDLGILFTPPVLLPILALAALAALPMVLKAIRRGA
ncbi:MAG: VTT domain-containing protein [Pseudomonadota bacterium]